jgi:hypothetical protein
MRLYVTNKSGYIAPYTSLVTSSMMGKSRLMKEVATHIPTVYICLRKGDRSYGYPKQTPNLADWFSQGALSLADKKMTQDYFFCFPTLKYGLFLLVTIKKLVHWIENGNILNPIEKGSMHEFGWLWEFFAEPSNEETLGRFWEDVMESIAKEFCEHSTGKKAHTYIVNLFRTQIKSAMQSFKRCLSLNENDPDSLTLLFMFDEARVLCEIEAMDGAPIVDELRVPTDTAADLVNRSSRSNPDDERVDPKASFSNFRALRRALRFASASDPTGIFAVLTDTNSRITNFQPPSWLDNSGRVPGLPKPGEHQFPPIFTFTSIDANSRMYNDVLSTSSPEKVADPERLLKFGRVGWYSVYCDMDEGGGADTCAVVGMAVIDLAKSKLLATPDLQRLDKPWNVNGPLNPRDLIKLLAVLAPRLAITVGPSTVEASEVIASHLACLTRTDGNRHFLRIAYPSEPILAHVSAMLTRQFGWDSPLKALNYYVKGGIVEAGFRGELLTKIVCLIAMDKALATIPTPSSQWSFARPITTSQFLNSLIVPLHQCNSFAEGLHGVIPGQDVTANTLNVDDKRLRDFLAGYVFFNHFVHVNVKLSFPMLVHAWNRGAAIMCKTNTPDIDYVIPVMLRSASQANLGPLHGIWNEAQIKEARRHLSYILINSRNYSNAKQQVNAAWAAKLSPRNITSGTLETGSSNDYFVGDDSDNDDPMEEAHTQNDTNTQYVVDSDEEFMAGDDCMEMEDSSDERSENVFMSLVQDFSSKGAREKWVTVGGIRSAHDLRNTQSRPLRSQFFVILKGIGSETYKCLGAITGEDPKRVTMVRQYLKELRRATIDYVEKDDDPLSYVGAMQNLPLVYGEEMLGSERWDSARQSRDAPVEKAAGFM